MSSGERFLRRHFCGAASSIVIVLMGKLGWVASYQDALPYVILVTWFGSEIVARLPSRFPVAVCEKCGRVQNLPRTSFRRFWPWKRCIVCGGQLQYFCSNKHHRHLLSLFADEIASSSIKDIWCSRCGEPSIEFSQTQFHKYLSNLIAQKPKLVNDPVLASLIWRMIKGTELGNALRGPMRDISNEYKHQQRLLSLRRFTSAQIPLSDELADKVSGSDPDDLF